jgi:adenosyl cobinamide kinase/adenosyl cobinamide phosphate guanylyltransferase
MMPDGVITKPRRGKLLGTTADTVKARKPKILVYGASGVGKTRWALDWPDVYVLDVEGGATQPEYRERLKASRGLYLGPDEGAASFDVVLDQVKLLTSETHDRKTLVIDSMTKLFANEIAREAEKLTDAGKKNEFGADKKPAVNYMRQLVAWLTRMNMNVILICGEVAEWGKEGGTGERTQIGTTFDCWPRLEYELDLAIQVVKLGNSRYGKVRKSRIAAFPHGHTFDWTYEAFTELYGRDVVEESGDRIVLVTPEQLADIARLLDTVKLPEGTVDKWLAAANVSTWDEIDTERAAKMIDNLKNRLAA